VKAWIPVIINPASSQKAAVLAKLNQVFITAGVRWSVEITLKDGDGTRIAQRLAKQGAEIVAVYGGDGTISEVASGLAGTNSALGILPGGTGNVLTYEFGIPRDLVRAARLLVGRHCERLVDMGQTGKRKFLLRAGAGLEASTVQRAPRELKDRFGILAYGISGLQALIDSRPVRYELLLDGKQVNTQGILCSIANAAHLGVIPGLTLAPPIDIEDGLLDVVVLGRLFIDDVIALLSRNLTSFGHWQHWQVHQAVIRADPPQATQLDGDHLGVTPLIVESVPKALRVIVPP
jgi:YegS/Rv2252/BmrU family lipid kinase